MPSVNKTANLGLNQWQGNEYVKRHDFVEDNKIIDDAFGRISEEVKNIDLSSNKVIRPNKKTVEESLSANETSILDHDDSISKLNDDLNNLTIEINGQRTKAISIHNRLDKIF